LLPIVARAKLMHVPTAHGHKRTRISHTHD
jgi:hypothetical protein